MVLLQFSLQYCSIYIALLFIVCNIHAQSFHPTVSPTLFPTLLPSVSRTVVAQSLLFKDLMYIVIAGIIFFIIGICVCIFAYYRVKKNRAIKKQQQPSYIVIKEKKKMRFKQLICLLFQTYQLFVIFNLYIFMFFNKNIKHLEMSIFSIHMKWYHLMSKK